MLFDDEIKYAVRTNNILYYNATDYSNPGESLESLAGNEGYIISKPVKGVQTIEPFTFPVATPADNNADYSFNVSLNPDMSTLAVSRTSTYRGMSKTSNINEALKYTPYMLDDYKYYGGESPTGARSTTMSSPRR